VGDVLHRDIQPAGPKQLGRRREKAFEVALGVSPKAGMSELAHVRIDTKRKVPFRI
jgi:hypothetical protein